MVVVYGSKDNGGVVVVYDEIRCGDGVTNYEQNSKL